MKNLISGPGQKISPSKNYPIHILTSIILNINAKNQKILANGEKLAKNPISGSFWPELGQKLAQININPFIL